MIRHCSLVVVLLSASAAFGQNISSSIKAVVVDPGGAAVPGAKCSLANQATGTLLTVTSETNGQCVFPNILAGTFTLRVQATGFKSLELKDVVVTSSEIRTLGNLSLQIGEVRESVTVTAEAGALQLASAEKSGLISEQQITNIAVKGRDFFALLKTIPGVVDTSTGGRDSAAGASGGIFISGSKDSAKNVAVDGVTDLDTGSNNSLHFQPNMDSIAELKILTSNFQAEFGRMGGGTVTVITKSGGQKFHGSAYNYYRHESLNANSFFNNRTGTIKVPYRYRISGYSIGGPVVIPGKLNRNKEKLFFFWSQEFIGQRKDYGTRFVNMPTALERQGDYSQSFDVSGALIAVRDPLTGQPFPGNIVPQNRINKLGQTMLTAFPLPNYTDPDPRNRYSRNYRNSYSGNYPKRQDMIRIDANLWPSFQVFYRFTRDQDEQNTAVNGSLNYFLTPWVNGRPGKGQVVHMTKLFSPTFFNEFIYGKSRNNLYTDAVNKDAVARSKFGNPRQWYADPYVPFDYAPDISFGGQPSSPVNFSPGNIPYVNYNDIYSFLDNVSKVWRSHNIKAGVYYERTGKFQVGNAIYRGQFNFSRNTNNPFDSNHSYANAILGNFSSYSEPTARVDGDRWFTTTEWFVQDNWRVSKRLTLDIGIRFYYLPPTEDLNRVAATFDPSLYDPKKAPALYVPAIDPSGKRVARDPLSGAYAIAPLIGQFVPGSGDYANGSFIGGKNGFPGGLVTSPGLRFGPRVGFAYDLFGTGKTAIRGGFGVFMTRVSSAPCGRTVGNPPIAYAPTLYYGNLDSYAQNAGALGPSVETIIFGYNKQPATMNYSFGIQEQVRNTAIDISYVGSLSRNLFMSQDINPIPMYARFQPANQDPTQPGKPLPDQFLVPYRGYAALSRFSTGASSNYNSLQISANRRFSHGLQFGAAFTWSKVLGVGTGDYDAVSSYFPVRSYNYGPLGYNRPNVLVLSYIYELPKVGARTGWKPARWVLDDWELSGISTFMTGAPFTPSLSTTDGQDITGSADGARITVTGDPRLGKGERNYYRNFRTEVFQRTPLRGFGNAGLSLLYGPGANNWDFSISKRMPLGSERRFLQFRAELFNAWNHTQFSGLYTTARFDPTGKQTDPNFGAYSSAREPRIIQLSLRVQF